MAQPGALSSDHINYLILRYLQESGHEDTARAFYRDWHRPREHRDPETLPFASTVRRYELVSVIQSGLTHDELLARVGRNERRFRWTTNGLPSIEENGEIGSRPSSSDRRKGRALPSGGLRAPDEFPVSAAKRQRLSAAPEAVHVNGDRDAMDVDVPSASPGDPEDDAEAASPEAPSEDATEAPAERYDSLDVATQTEIRRGPKTSTVSFGVSKPGAKIFHSSWSPSGEKAASSLLLATGEGLCRYYSVPEVSEGDVDSVAHVDQSSIPPNSSITSVAWHPSGTFATCAVDTLRELSDGKRVSKQMIMDVRRDSKACVYPPSLPLLDPAGLVLNLCYSPDGAHLLVVNTNLKRGLVQVFETSTAEGKSDLRKDPVAWRIFEHQVLDVAWTNVDSFVVCGAHGLTSFYSLRKPEGPTTNGFTPASIAVHHLAEQTLDIAPGTSQWDKVRHDAKRGLTIFASTSDRKVVAFLGPNAGTSEESSQVVLEIPEQLTAIALQPSSSATTEKSILAMSFEDGKALLYSYSSSRPVGFERLAFLDLNRSPALALSWSPNGQHLALGGTDSVRIWRIENEQPPSNNAPPLVDWKLGPAASANVNGSDDSEALSEPSLSWTADGERLCFAVERQIAVIAFRPPLLSGGFSNGNGASDNTNGEETRLDPHANGTSSSTAAPAAPTSSP